MFRVVCIDNDNITDSLTLDKVYEVISVDRYGIDQPPPFSGYYSLIDDESDLCAYPKKRFITLSKLRKDKINKLCLNK